MSFEEDVVSSEGEVFWERSEGLGLSKAEVWRLLISKGIGVITLRKGESFLGDDGWWIVPSHAQIQRLLACKQGLLYQQQQKGNGNGKPKDSGLITVVSNQSRNKRDHKSRFTHRRR